MRDVGQYLPGEEETQELLEKDHDDLTDAELTAKIKLSIKRRFSRPEWVLMFEYGAPQGQAVCDCIAVNTIASRNYKVVGMEFKASRSDWLREKRNPQKADYFVQRCDEWYIVAGGSFVDEDELPEGWGLLELKPNSEQIWKIRESNLTEHQAGEFGRRFWVRFLEQTVGDETNFNQSDLKEAHNRGYQEGLDETSESDVDYNVKRLRTKADRWDTLQDRGFGFVWRMDEEALRTLELAWKLIGMVHKNGISDLTGDVDSLRRSVERKTEKMQNAVETLDEGIDILERRIEDGQVPEALQEEAQDG